MTTPAPAEPFTSSVEALTSGLAEVAGTGLRIDTAKDNRLAQLITAYAEAHAAHAEAEKRKDELNSAIKAELTGRFVYPDPSRGGEPAPFERYELTAAGQDKPWVLRWGTSRRIDSKRLQAELPDVYARYAPAKGGWVLEKKRGQS